MGNYEILLLSYNCRFSRYFPSRLRDAFIPTSLIAFSIRFTCLIDLELMALTFNFTDGEKFMLSGHEGTVCFLRCFSTNAASESLSFLIEDRSSLRRDTVPSNQLEKYTGRILATKPLLLAATPTPA